ncbi:MAG: hypothetical protein IGBAC_0143 [Ignavibacteriae bacterium]|nr:MAG: hypothetical protein IGBAC_0143 [Ignavibacteriota bacterium]
MWKSEAIKIVARFARAWIETISIKQMEYAVKVARFARAWIETIDTIIKSKEEYGRTLRACVD